MDVTLLSATAQADLIRGRELSARELLEAVVERYRRLDPGLNAVVVERIDEAGRQAAEADEQLIAAGDPSQLGCFHGVPATVKEVFDWVGTPSTWGDPALVDHRPLRSAAAVDRLLGAGAVIWGKTNVPFLLGQWQSFNDIYGVTRNPFDAERTAGGSSGGSAASLAAGFAALEIGSDIGGSIRFPAHYCGVFGHKPSFGIMSAAGHTYPGQDAEVDINVVGPMARSAADLAAMLQVLARRVLPVEGRRRFGDFRVAVLLENPCGGEQDAAMTAVLEAAVAAIVEAGARPVELASGIDHVRAQEVYRLLNHAATALVDGGADDAAHARRFDRGDRDFDAWLGKGGALTHKEWIRLANERERLRGQWRSYFDHVDVLLCPVSASAAPPHQTDRRFADQTIPVNGRDVSALDQWFWAGIASGAYLPATVAPVGRTDEGLPVGLQIIGPYAHDLRTIAFAGFVEDLLGGFHPPS